MGFEPAADCGTIWHIVTPKAINARQQAKADRFRHVARWPWVAPIVLLALFTMSIDAAAQGTRNAAKAPLQSAFQILHLNDRSVLFGVLLGRNSSEVYFAVRRDWLKQNESTYKRLAATVTSEERIAYEQLRDRLETELAAHADQPHRFLLEKERDRAIAWLSLESPPESELMLLKIPRANVVRLENSDASNVKLAICAWSKQVVAPEMMPVKDLRKSIKDAGVDIENDMPDLGNRFQALPQSDDEWLARLALVRYSRVKAIEFQGTKELMTRIGDTSQPADVASLIAQTLKNQSQNIVNELLIDPLKSSRPSAPKGDWIEKCTSTLRDENEDYLRATCVESDSLAGQVRVESVFIFKSSQGTWIPIWRLEMSTDTNSVSETSLRKLDEDPQIQSIRSLLSSLGIVSDQTIQDAMRLGAATMQSQQGINSRFEFFRQRFQNRLDLPVLRWDISQN